MISSGANGPTGRCSYAVAPDSQLGTHMATKIKDSFADIWRWLVRSAIGPREVDRDVDSILWSARLNDIYRYSHQRFWEKETRELEIATNIQGVPRLESVSEHSWHLADIALLIFHRFQPLDLGKCISLAVLHDKLEIITGDKNPVGRDGTGKSTHAFNPTFRSTRMMKNSMLWRSMRHS